MKAAMKVAMQAIKRVIESDTFSDLYMLVLCGYFWIACIGASNGAGSFGWACLLGCYAQHEAKLRRLTRVNNLLRNRLGVNIYLTELERDVVRMSRNEPR